MSRIAVFTANPWQENAYLLSDDTGACVVVDPGCQTPAEQAEITAHIEQEGLRPEAVLNTHCHLDHVFGNRFLCEHYGIPLITHKGEVPVLDAAATYAKAVGMPYDPSPAPDRFLDHGDRFRFGKTELTVRLAPGHSPASICFYQAEDAYLIGGDVLFQDSIGRYDLPGGDLDTLLRSIHEQVMSLPDDTVVYPGHGPSTRVGREREHNPFLNLD